MSDLAIRPAIRQDLATIHAIARRTVDVCYRPFLGNDGVDWYLGSGASEGELGLYLDELNILTDGDEIVGFSIFLDGRIHLMMVDVRRQRAGLGATLLAHAEQTMFAERERIHLETFQGNAQAIAFYEKHGWREVRRQPDPEHGFVRVFFEKTREGGEPTS